MATEPPTEPPAVPPATETDPAGVGADAGGEPTADIRLGGPIEGGSPLPRVGYRLGGAPGEIVIRQEGLPSPSERDIAVYEAGCPGWGEHHGRHVLIYQGEVCGFFETRNVALHEGYRRFGRVPFLVKQVDPDERPRSLAGVVF